MEKVDPAQKTEKLPLGVNCIDTLMGGGLEAGVITELYGEGGSGKSNMSMLFALSAIKKGKTAILLDTEGFSTDRFMQVSGESPESAKSLLLYRVSSLDDQELAIMRVSKMLDKSSKIGVVIVDSFTEYFRVEKSDDHSSRTSGFQKQLGLLSTVAMKGDIPVLITNQIYMDVESKLLNPFGGFVINHSMKAIYQLERLSPGKRSITITKHRSLPEGSRAEFKIVDYGISCEV